MKKLTAVMALLLITACSDDGGTSIESFCRQAASAQTSLVQLSDEGSDSASAIAAFDDLAKNAPNEIKADMTTIVNYLKNPTASASAGTTAVAEASQRVAQFFEDKCQVNLDSGPDNGSKFSSVASSIN